MIGSRRPWQLRRPPFVCGAQASASGHPVDATMFTESASRSAGMGFGVDL